MFLQTLLRESGAILNLYIKRIKIFWLNTNVFTVSYWYNSICSENVTWKCHFLIVSVNFTDCHSLSFILKKTISLYFYVSLHSSKFILEWKVAYDLRSGLKRINNCRKIRLFIKLSVLYHPVIVFNCFNLNKLIQMRLVWHVQHIGYHP